jgi:hypothetical protein
MKKSILFLILFLLLGSIITTTVSASITWADHTVIVDNNILTALETLTYDVDVVYLAVVDVYHVSTVYVVSLVGLPSTADPNDWSITEAAWIGTAAISDDYTQAALEGSALYDTLTAPVYDDWGGLGEIPIFPWESGKKAYYGTRAVHDAGYGLEGWKAVDWVSGPSYGTGFYSNAVYASEDAQITYVCRDSTQVAIVAGGFLYSHLKDNATLEIGQNLYKGVKFAELVTGSFSDSCGWASQQPGNYHIHWGFNPDSGIKQIEDWTLDITSQVWTKGSQSVYVGDAMLSSGTSYIDSGDEGDFTSSMDGSHVWDSPISSFIETTIKRVLPRFPEGESRELGLTYTNAAGVAIRIFYVLLKSNFDLTLFSYFMGAMLVLEPVRIIYAVYKLILKAIPVVG